MCWITPGPSTSMSVAVCPLLTRRKGRTFQPCPRSSAARADAARGGIGRIRHGHASLALGSGGVLGADGAGPGMVQVGKRSQSLVQFYRTAGCWFPWQPVGAKDRVPGKTAGRRVATGRGPRRGSVQSGWSTGRRFWTFGDSPLLFSPTGCDGVVQFPGQGTVLLSRRSEQCARIGPKGHWLARSNHIMPGRRNLPIPAG